MVAHFSDTFSLYSSHIGHLDISQIIQAWLCIYPSAYNALPPNSCNLSFDLNVIFSVETNHIIEYYVTDTPFSLPSWLPFMAITTYKYYLGILFILCPSYNRNNFR